jgi:hypothetical protein
MRVAGLQSMAGSIQISNDTVAAVESPAHEVTAEDLAKSDLWIFREGRREFSGAAFLRELQQRLAAKNALVDCLIQAGELEAALADLGAPGSSTASVLTDSLALQLCGNSNRDDVEELAGRIEVPATINISPPEGFTYYALHPLDFAKTAAQIANESATYAVIGIRSIGTTLSAVVTAELNKLAKKASRITVRPQGHPYSRSTEFSAQEQDWIAQQQANGALFLIVDEGPGRSGSTFLSVAEALSRAGVPYHRVVILGSRPFDPATLCAQGAAERWRHYRFIAVASSLSQRFTNYTYLGGGDWRYHFCDDEHNWPESWTQMERFKVFSPDRREFLKFEGMGRIGNEAKERAFALAKAAFSPEISDAGDGFLAYAAINGMPLRKQNVNAEILESIARYCAFRAAEFRCTGPASSELENMLVYNIQQEFGCELKLPLGQLSSVSPVLVDGRMQPYEWISLNNGSIVKTDGVSHGDNHFFPGPCGIVWDLAGTIIEWDLSAPAIEFLVTKFCQFSGTDTSRELNVYKLAYCVFRLGFCKMARSTVLGTNEERRLDLAYRQYRAKAAQLLLSFE